MPRYHFPRAAARLGNEKAHRLGAEGQVVTLFSLATTSEGCKVLIL